MTEAPSIAPQPGPQTEFLSTEADIAIYGGAAGGGKTYALLLEPLRHIHNPDFRGVTFRRTYKQVEAPGGLWDESTKLYTLLGAKSKRRELEWVFESGAQLKFAHLQHEDNVYDWQGSQIPFIAFDELTHFSRSQFFYLLSRNRSTCGIRPYIRATCNPDAASWVAEFIAWWIDEDTGYPIPERAGKIRWFLRRGDALIWSSDRQELVDRYGTAPKSVTFIPAKLDSRA